MTTAAHPAVAPVGFWDRLAIVVLGLAGCALSYDALQQMAVAIHIRGFLTYLFPLVIDGFIAYGVRALLVLSEAPLRARLYVWVLFGTATAASIWANALHAVRLNQQTTHSGLHLGDAVVAILSTLAPLALAGAVHLFILITRHHPGAGHSAARREKASEKRKTNLVRRMWTKRRRRGERQRSRADLTARPTDHGPASASAPEPRTSPADRLADASGLEHGPAQEPGPASADHSSIAVQDHLPTADEPTELAPADHDAPAADQRTNPAPDQPADHDTATADQQTGAGPQKIDSDGWTGKTAGQAVLGSHGPAGHERAGHERGPAQERGPASADQGAPADQMPALEHPQTTDQATESAPADHDAPAADQRTSSAPDHADHDVHQPADHPADRDEDGSSGGPQGARTTGHDSPDTSRTKPADHDDEVPWEVKVEVARKAALREGLMSRRVIRPHLRRHNISISNEGFRELQDQLYADPALAHLPRNRRRS